jgi:cellulose biosynthesis protein BcsQ
MKSVIEITEALRQKDMLGYKTSTYQMIDDVLVRVSNHLPQVYNVESNNEGIEKIFFIFAEPDLTQREIESHLEQEFSNNKYDYVLIDDSYDYTREDVLKMINRAF